jgi:hypothetical protein
MEVRGFHRIGKSYQKINFKKVLQITFKWFNIGIVQGNIINFKELGKMYKTFTKKQFEFLMRGMLINGRLGFMEEIDNGVDTWEHVYKISTKNKAVDILVFSSVDMRNGKTREKGSDAVRLVMRWNTKYGYIYKKLAKHYRLETLFQNMEKTIRSAHESVFKLNGKEFSKNIA